MQRNKRMPAEWENPTSVLMAWPTIDTDWDYIIREARHQFGRIVESLTANDLQVLLLCKENIKECMKTLEEFPDIKPEFLQIIDNVDYNDTWTRDYGPLTVVAGSEFLELDFGFNGWGLKFASNKDNLVNLFLTEKGWLRKERYSNHRDFTLEGGSIESDGNGTLLTTSHCLLSQNRNGGKSKEEVETILVERLGAERVLWLDHGFLEGDDTDHHIDTLARLAPKDTIIYIGPPSDISDPHYDELITMKRQIAGFKTKEGNSYNLVELPFPDPIYDEDGNRLPATYANYLVTSSMLFVPVYSQPLNDAMALRRLGEAFPQHKIIGVECSTLLKQHGSLHCSTMQLY